MCIDILFSNILKELHVFCYLGQRIIPTKLIQMTKKQKNNGKIISYLFHVLKNTYFTGYQTWKPTYCQL
jgi:hypothetical protein